MRIQELDTVLIQTKRQPETETSQDAWGPLHDQVLSSITHDLRAPLCAIMGYLDLVGLQVDESAAPKTAEYISLARQASQRMHQMVNDMLDMFRIENGESFLQLKKLSVAALFENVQRTFAGLAQLKHI